MPRESAWKKKHFCSCYLDVCPVLICISGFSLSPLCPPHFFPSRWFFKGFWFFGDTQKLSAFLDFSTAIFKGNTICFSSLKKNLLLFKKKQKLWERIFKKMPSQIILVSRCYFFYYNFFFFSLLFYPIFFYLLILCPVIGDCFIFLFLFHFFYFQPSK